MELPEQLKLGQRRVGMAPLLGRCDSFQNNLAPRTIEDSRPMLSVRVDVRYPQTRFVRECRWRGFGLGRS